MWRWATEKAARFPRVRIRHDPAAGRTGSVLEIIDIERPFQMDSIVAELSEQGHVAVAIFPAVVPDGWDPAERESADPGAQLRFVQILLRSEEHTSELQSLMRISYAVFCLKK